MVKKTCIHTVFGYLILNCLTMNLFFIKLIFFLLKNKKQKISSIGRDIIKTNDKPPNNQQMSNNFNENTSSPLSNSNSISNNLNEMID